MDILFLNLVKTPFKGKRNNRVKYVYEIILDGNCLVRRTSVNGYIAFYVMKDWADGRVKTKKLPFAIVKSFNSVQQLNGYYELKMKPYAVACLPDYRDQVIDTVRKLKFLD